MSGNPFRRQPPQEQKQTVDPVESSRAFEDAIRSAFHDTGRKPSTTKKTVRIQTPSPLSPDPISPEEGSPLIRRVSNEGHTGSPPPLSPVDGASAISTGQLEQPGKRLGDEVAFQAEAVIDNTRRNSQTPAVPPTSSSSSSAAPWITNPFQKTLATIEPRIAQSKSADDGNGEQIQNSAAPDTLSSRPAGALDVDAFTRMLMTGEGPPRPTIGQDTAGMGSINHTSAKQDVTAGTAASSLESAEQGPAPNETSTRVLSSSDNAITPTTGIISVESVPKSKASKPPPPKHRHGRFVNDEGPKTVSFDDFERQATKNTTRSSAYTSTLSGEPGRLSPSPMSKSGLSSQTTSSESQQQLSGGLNGTRRAAPPVPLVRRNTGSHEHTNTQSDTASSASPLSSPRLPINAAQPPQSSKAPKPPPPPPTRRVANRNSLPPDQMPISDAISITPETASLTDDYGSIDSTSAKRSLNAMPGSSRSSSISERTAAPPPPPPRRRRGSSNRSMEPPPGPGTRSPNDTRRSSVELNKRGSLDIPQRVSSLSQVSEDGNVYGQRQPQGNVLADLSALQAEVEALRNQYRRSG